MRRRKDEYFIGMVDLYAANQKYKKMKRRKRNQVALRRTLIVLAVCLVASALVAVSYFAIVPAMGNLFSMLDARSTVAAASDEDKATETLPATVDETEPVTEAPTEVPTEAHTEAPAEPDDTVFVAPVIADDGSDGTLYSSTLYLWQDKGFNLFSSTDKVAKHYAKTINTLADGLGDDVTVYSMVVPNHTEFGLPQRIIESGIKSDSQADNIKCIYDNLNKDIVAVNCYNALSAHASEYIYYNTDHHWTSLGAFYAYTAFCEKAGLEPMDISGLEKNTIGGFTGSFYSISGSAALYANSDTVEYYNLPNNTYAYLKERMSSDTIKVDVYYPASTGGSLTYGVFCWGDAAQFTIHSDAGTGKKIAVVKDSYGNAFAPYLTANYDEVHLIDYRYYSGDLNEYLSKNGIDEVIFLNNTMSANNTSQVDIMSSALS